MRKIFIALTWKICCRMARLITFLADSWESVTGVLFLLGYLQLSVAMGAIIVLIGLIGIDAFLARLDRSEKLNAKAEELPTSANNKDGLQAPPKTQEDLNRNQLHVTTSANAERISDHSLKLNVAGENCELRLSLFQRPLEITIGESVSKGIVVEIREGA